MAEAMGFEAVVGINEHEVSAMDGTLEVREPSRSNLPPNRNHFSGDDGASEKFGCRTYSLRRYSLSCV